MHFAPCHVLVCRGPECSGRGVAEVFGRFIELVTERELASHVRLDRQSCFGRCRYGPNIYVSFPRTAPGEFQKSPLQRSILPERPTESTPVPSGLPEQLAVPRAALYHHVAPHDVDTIVDRHIIGGYVVAELTRRKAHVADRFASSPGSSFPENG